MRELRNILILFLLFTAADGYCQDGMPEFEGYVGSPMESQDNLYKRFNDFMLNNEGNEVYINVTLDEDQMNALRTPTDDFYFFAVYDEYDERLSGIEYHIMKFKTPANFEISTNGNTLDGVYKIDGISGPQNGLLVIEMMPVKKKRK